MRNFDWNLRSCGWHGHITYRPDESELAERLEPPLRPRQPLDQSPAEEPIAADDQDPETGHRRAQLSPKARERNRVASA